MTMRMRDGAWVDEADGSGGAPGGKAWLFSQSLRDTLFDPGSLVALGLIWVRGPTKEGKSKALEALREEIRKEHPEADIVVGCQLVWDYSGHPSNGDWFVCVTGDAYSLKNRVAGLRELPPLESRKKGG